MARLNDERSGGYRQVLRTRGLRPIAAAGVAGGIAMQGAPVALVLLGRDATGSFAGAGTLLAAGTVGGLLFAPARARLVDRRGPIRTLPPLGLAGASLATALALSADGDAPLGVLAALAFLAAAVSPPLGAVMRNLFRDLLPDGPTRHTGFGLMTVLQEVTFFAGPLVAGAAIALASPAAAVIALGCLSAAAAIAFAASSAARASRAEQHGQADDDDKADKTESGPLGALALPGIRTLFATFALMGATFGLLDVALPAIARHHGQPGAAGVLLSAIALGIGLGGFAYGLRPPRRAAGVLYPPLCALAGLGLVPVALAGGDVALGVLAPLLVVTGLLYAPVTTCSYALLDDVAPRSQTTEALALLGVAYGAASAVGAQAAGALVGGPGLRAPLIAAVGCAAVATLVAATRRRSLLRADATIDVA